MSEVLFIVGDVAVTAGIALMAFAGLVLALLVVIAVVLARGSSRSEAATMAQAIRADEVEERLADMLRAQAEATGRMQAMGEALAGRQSEMARAVNEPARLGHPPRRPVDGTVDPQHDGLAAPSA